MYSISGRVTRNQVKMPENNILSLTTSQEATYAKKPSTECDSKMLTNKYVA